MVVTPCHDEGVTLIPANLTVEMGMNVDKAWRYQLALGVYFVSTTVYVANFNNSTVQIATSAAKPSTPVPSIMVPFRITMS